MSENEALTELRERADKAAKELRRQASAKSQNGHGGRDEYLRLSAKATGVELVRSYIDDALTLSSSVGSAS